MSQKLVLAYDLGGTKVAAGIVNDRGRILQEIREPVVINQGKTAVVRQLIDIGDRLLTKYPRARKIGIASAGPLDIEKGVLLDPTNYITDGKGWGKVPITKLIGHGLKRTAFLENDAAAAMLAEHWVGAARGKRNAMILTLGTGVGVGTVSNNQLERSGRMLHPEASHLIIRADDPDAPCGCGNFGCLEAYLSGRNFAARTAKNLSRPHLTGEELVALAYQGDPVVLAGFAEYSRLLAVSIQNFVRLYAPEVIVFTGSFAAAGEFFLPGTQAHLEKMLVRLRVGMDLLPKLTLSKLDNRAGLVGAAFVALNR